MLIVLLLALWTKRSSIKAPSRTLDSHSVDEHIHAAYLAWAWRRVLHEEGKKNQPTQTTQQYRSTNLFLHTTPLIKDYLKVNS